MRRRAVRPHGRLDLSMLNRPKAGVYFEGTVLDIHLAYGNGWSDPVVEVGIEFRLSDRVGKALDRLIPRSWFR